MLSSDEGMSTGDDATCIVQISCSSIVTKLGILNRAQPWRLPDLCPRSRGQGDFCVALATMSTLAASRNDA